MKQFPEIDKLPASGMEFYAWTLMAFLLNRYNLAKADGPMRFSAKRPILGSWPVVVDFVPRTRGGMVWLRMQGRGPHETLTITYAANIEARKLSCMSIQRGRTRGMYFHELEDGMRVLAEWERDALRTLHGLVDDGWLLDRAEEMPVSMTAPPPWELKRD